jgi:hypothetical protein
MSSVVNAVSAALSVVAWNALASHAVAFVGGAVAVLAPKFVSGTLTQWRKEWHADRTDAMEWYENVASDAQTVEVAIRQSPYDERLSPAITDLDERLDSPPMLVESDAEDLGQTLVNVYDDFDGESPKLRAQLKTKATKLRRLADENATEKRERATAVRRFLKKLSR